MCRATFNAPAPRNNPQQEAAALEQDSFLWFEAIDELNAEFEQAAAQDAGSSGSASSSELQEQSASPEAVPSDENGERGFGDWAELCVKAGGCSPS